MTMPRSSVGARRRSWAASTVRLAELTGAMQQMLVTEIAELRGDAQLLQLLRDSVDGNVATVFSAIRHAIPIEKVELPTAALEHARRLAQRGVTVNALVRAYRLGHKALLDAVLDEIRGVGPGAAAEPRRVSARSQRSRSATSTGSLSRW